MSLSKFIPQIWSAQLLQNLHKRLVYAQTGIANRDYEGEISGKGDTVKIHGIGPVTVFDVSRNTDIPAPEQLTDDERTLVIDQSKGFNFQVDDADAAQINPKVMSEAMREAAYALATKADTYVGGLYTGVAAGNTIGDDTAPVEATASGATSSTSEPAYEILVDLSTKLDESDVPDMDRTVIVPPWFYGLLLKDDRFVKSGTPTGDQVLRNGQVGEAAGFTVLKSNTVPFTPGDGAAGTVDRFKVQASVPMARSFAEQINKTEAYRPEARFADAVKGLHLYGAKLVRPECLAVATVTKPGA